MTNSFIRKDPNYNFNDLPDPLNGVEVILLSAVSTWLPAWPKEMLEVFNLDFNGESVHALE